MSHFESQRLVPKELQSGWHNPQKVVDMEPYKEKQLLGVVPSTLKPLYLLLFSHQGLFFCDNASETISLRGCPLKCSQQALLDAGNQW